jgi:nitroreductase
MDEHIRKLLEAQPEKPLRSKLEPHEDVIRALRLKRRTYAEIAAFFAAHLDLPVAPSTIHAFVKVRDRRKKARSREEFLPEGSSPAPYRPDKKAGIADRIAAARQRRPPETAKATGFAYDPEKENLQPIRKGDAS